MGYSDQLFNVFQLTMGMRLVNYLIPIPHVGEWLWNETN